MYTYFDMKKLALFVLFMAASSFFAYGADPQTDPSREAVVVYTTLDTVR